MKRLMVRTGMVVFLLSAKSPAQSYAQSGTAIPQADPGHAAQASCVILKRMGRVDRTKTRLYTFGISGKQFSYVEGKLPEGFSLHHKMTDHDVRNLQARGAQVLVLDSHYTSEDLQEARADCQGESGKMTNQVEAAASPAPAPMAAPEPVTKATPPPAKVPTPKPEDSASSAGTTVAALIDVSSTPSGADVYIDERFFGRTPATTIILVPGDHKIAIKKDGFAVWRKKLKFPSGRISVDADLRPKTK